MGGAMPRWRPPPTQAPKERMNCTIQEHIADIKSKDKSKDKSKTLADWEKQHDNEASAEGPLCSAAQSSSAAGPAAPKEKKAKKDKKKEKKDKKKKAKKDKKKKDKKKDKKEKKKD